MFKFRDFRSEELAAWEKQEMADEQLKEIKEDYKIEYSTLLENLFISAEVTSFKCLEGIAAFFKTENQRLGLIVVPYDHNSDFSKADIRDQLDLFGMSRTSVIPYFSWSFPEDYDNPHGSRYQHVYFFFVTKYKEFKVAEECIAYYVDKYDRLGSFI